MKKLIVSVMLSLALSPQIALAEKGGIKSWVPLSDVLADVAAGSQVQYSYLIGRCSGFYAALRAAMKDSADRSRNAIHASWAAAYEDMAVDLTVMHDAMGHHKGRDIVNKSTLAYFKHLAEIRKKTSKFPDLADPFVQGEMAICKPTAEVVTESLEEIAKSNS